MKVFENENYIKAVRLFNLPDGDCTFEHGKIPANVNIESTLFFAQANIDAYEIVPHPAPRRQYVITLKGRLLFKVTSGDTFVIEPGIILVAEDTEGMGHTWDLIDGDTWERIYIALKGDSHFVQD